MSIDYSGYNWYNSHIFLVGRELNMEVIMKGYFLKKITCLFCACAVIGTSLIGCGNDDKDSESRKTDSFSESNLEETTLNSSEVTTTGGIENDSSMEEQTTSKQETTEMTTEVTTKEPTTTEDVTTGTPTTEKQTTKKTENKTTQKTTQKTTSKPKPVEQTTTAPKVTKAEQMAKAIVDDIITSKMSEFDKALAIHDWLTFNLDYDFTYSNYYVEDALTDRRCVCQGYALTFKMMCEMVGLNVIYVTGEGYSDGSWGGHAWNQVRIDGQWYNVDVTWDDPASPGKNFNDHSGNRHEYFLISDSRINKDHRATSSGRQTCSSDYDRVAIVKAATNNTYHSEFGFATNAGEMAAAINKLVEMNKTKFYIKYHDPSLNSQTMWDGIWDKLKLAKYPINLEPSYAPVDGIATYVLSVVVPLSEWNKIQVVTSQEELDAIFDQVYNSGQTKLTIRYEPVDGNVWFGSDKYIFNLSQKLDYNDGKCTYTTIEITGLQIQP